MQIISLSPQSYLDCIRASAILKYEVDVTDELQYLEETRRHTLDRPDLSASSSTHSSNTNSGMARVLILKLHVNFTSLIMLLRYLEARYAKLQAQTSDGQ